MHNHAQSHELRKCWGWSAKIYPMWQSVFLLGECFATWGSPVQESLKKRFARIWWPCMHWVYSKAIANCKDSSDHKRLTFAGAIIERKEYSGNESSLRIAAVTIEGNVAQRTPIFGARHLISWQPNTIPMPGATTHIHKHAFYLAHVLLCVTMYLCSWPSDRRPICWQLYNIPSPGATQTCDAYLTSNGCMHDALECIHTDSRYWRQEPSQPLQQHIAWYCAMLHALTHKPFCSSCTACTHIIQFSTKRRFTVMMYMMVSAIRMFVPQAVHILKAVLLLDCMHAQRSAPFWADEYRQWVLANDLWAL